MKTTTRPFVVKSLKIKIPYSTGGSWIGDVGHRRLQHVICGMKVDLTEFLMDVKPQARKTFSRHFVVSKAIARFLKSRNEEPKVPLSNLRPLLWRGESVILEKRGAYIFSISSDRKAKTSHLHIRWLEVDGVAQKLEFRGGVRFKWYGKDHVVKFENFDFPQMFNEIAIQEVLKEEDKKYFPRLLEYDLKKGYTVFPRIRFCMKKKFKPDQVQVDIVDRLIDDYDLKDVSTTSISYPNSRSIINPWNWTLTSKGEVCIFDYGLLCGKFGVGKCDIDKVRRRAHKISGRKLTKKMIPQRMSLIT